MTSAPAKYINPRRNPRRRTSLFDDHDRDHESTLKVLKTIQGHPGRWTITDSHLSPDNERQAFNYRTKVEILNNTIQDDLFIYCEWIAPWAIPFRVLSTMGQSPTVYMTNTLDSSTVQTPIRFADQGRHRSRSLWGVYDDDSFGIWSCRFSADGNEVIAGGSGNIFGRRRIPIPARIAHASSSV